MYIRWLRKGLIESTKYFVHTVNILSTSAPHWRGLELGKILFSISETVVPYPWIVVQMCSHEILLKHSNCGGNWSIKLCKTEEWYLNTVTGDAHSYARQIW
jgi:hypothetical protein